MTLCSDICPSAAIRQPTSLLQTLLFDSTSPDYIGPAVSDTSVMPWLIAHVIDMKSSKAANKVSREPRPKAGQVIHYAKSLMRRSPESLRFAAVVCHIHPSGGVFYRFKREGPILCSEMSDLTDVAIALTSYLMTPPQYLGINIDICHHDMWSVFLRLTPVSHGGSALVFREKKRDFGSLIPRDSESPQHDDEQWIGKVSQTSCVDECVYLKSLYEQDGFQFHSACGGEVLLTNMVGIPPSPNHWKSVPFLNACWEQISRLHKGKLVHRDLREPNFIIDANGGGKVIDLQSVVAADEFCVYHGSIETASPHVWSALLEYKTGESKRVSVLPIDDAVSFMLCTLIVRFDLHRDIALTIRNGLDLKNFWSSKLRCLFLDTKSCQEMLLISLVKSSLEICCGALRFEEYDVHLEITARLMQNFIDLASRE